MFAYGATGAGKTYTMLGTTESPGITFSAVMALFSQIDDGKNDRVYDVSVSYLEVFLLRCPVCLLLWCTALLCCGIHFSHFSIITSVYYRYVIIVPLKIYLCCAVDNRCICLIF